MEKEFDQENHDEEYELFCEYWDMYREQLAASWGVESWEELEELGHDW